MGCFSIPKNKSKVAAASQQAEQQQQHTNFYYGSKVELLSSSQPVVLPDPDDLAGGKPQGIRPLQAATSIRGSGGKQHLQQQNQKGGKERRGGSPGSYSKNSAGRIVNQPPRALSAPFNYHSYPPTGEEHRPSLQVSQSDNCHAVPFSAPLPSLPSLQPDKDHALPFSGPLSTHPTPLDGSSSPVSPPAPASHESPLHTLIVSVSASEIVNRAPQLGLDKRVTKAFVDRKARLFTGRPLRLPKPQPATAHPLPLPQPPELDDAAATGLQAGFTASLGSSSSVSPSPTRKKEERFGPSSHNGFRSIGGGGGGNSVEALPLPPPALPTHNGTPVRAFPFGELAPALVPECFLGEGVFGRAYRALIDDHGEDSNEKKVEVAVVCPMVKSLQGLRDWMAEVNWLARLQNPHLCKLIGYSAEDASGPGNKRLLVYEFMNNGSLDMFVKSNEGSTPPLDWSARMRIALDVAQGLAYLHDKAPFQVICRDLSSPSIQLDKEFKAKLSGFGLARCGPEGDQGLLMVGPYVAPESGRSGLVTIKSNAWSFGVVLLELLTGRRHMDASLPSGQQNLIQLTKPFLRDEGKLFLIMDPELNGRYSGRGALKVANLAFQCLINEASLRPNLSEAVDVLKTVQIDEDSLAFDLKKSRSLTQSVGSPVTYCRSTSDHFVQRAFNSNSVTSSPSNDPKQRDREFLKSAAFGPVTLSSKISSPSFMESRLSTDQKPPKNVFSVGDAQKLSPPGQQQPFESRLIHGDINQQRERDQLKVATSFGTSVPSSSFGDSKRPSSSVQVHGRGEFTKLQALNVNVPVPNGGIKQQIGQPEELSKRSQPQEASHSSETKQQGVPTTKFQAPQAPQAPQATVSPQYSEVQQQTPKAQKSSLPEYSPSRTSRSGELKPQSPERWKSLSRQSSFSSRSRSGEQTSLPLRSRSEHAYLSSRSRSGEQKPRISDARKLPTPQSLQQKASGESKQQIFEAFKPSRSRPCSGEIRQPHAASIRKVFAPSYLLDSSHHSSDIRQHEGEFQKQPADDHRQHSEREEQEVQKSLSQSAGSSRLSCAPALSFDPPRVREEFCVW